MRLLIMEHDRSRPVSNITTWADKKGYPVIKIFPHRNEILPGLDDFDWLIILGGPQHAWEDEANPWLPGEKRFIFQALTAGRMVLGVCLGAQILAEILGGRAFAHEYKEIGWHEVTLMPEGRQSFLFNGLPEAFPAFHWHEDHFSLPPDCTRLAFSQASPNQAFICHKTPAIGLQFHPEFTADIIRTAAERYGDQYWLKGPYVAGKEAILAETDNMPDNYWIMETLLDNIEREYSRAENGFFRRPE